MIAADLHGAIDPEQQLGLLLTKWGFRLPTATAILAVLYADTFTIYDIRVCNRLRAFRQLGDMQWSPKAWREYQPKSGSWMIARWRRIVGNYRDGDRNDESGRT
jgi:hypothetical protein